MKLYARKNRLSTVLATLSPQEGVEALTGEVHTRPGKFRFQRRYESRKQTPPHDPFYYKIGELLWVYTNQGEGFFKVWYKGQFFDESPPGWGKDPAGTWIVKPHSTWWIRIRTKRGILGWTDEGQHFDYSG